MDYVDETWLNSSAWAVQSWCMFGQTTRTNNDCEGWHHRINKRAKKGEPTVLSASRPAVQGSQHPAHTGQDGVRGQATTISA